MPSNIIPEGHNSSHSRRRSRDGHRSGRGERSERKSKTLKELHACRKNKLWLLLLLVFVVLGWVVSGLFIKGYVNSARKDKNALEAKLYRMQATFDENEAAMKQMKEDMDAVVKGRIPGLKSIVFDEVIRIDDQYVKNILFTLRKKGEEINYEYKIVLHNQTPSVLEPRVQIYLFSRTSLQIGYADLKGGGDAVLIADESRSHSGSFDISQDGEPVYFMVKVH